MDVNDVLIRVLRGHWRMLCVCLLVPVVVVVGLALTSSRAYGASSRLQGGTIIPGSDTEADALLNLVKGVATSDTAVYHALDDAGMPPSDAPATAANVTVTRLGSSTVFDLSVTAPTAQQAVRLTRSLADSVVTYINNSGDARTANLLQGLDKRQKDLLDQRQQTASALALSKDPITTANLQAQLSGIDQQLADIRSTMQQLELGGTSAASSGSATVISPAAVTGPVATHLSADVGLALVIGLVVGLLAASIAETVRPRLAGPRSLARQLGVGVIGTLPAVRRQSRRHRQAGGAAPDGQPGDALPVVAPEVVLGLRRAAARAGADQVLVVGPEHDAVVPGVVAALRQALSERVQAESHRINGVPVERPGLRIPLAVPVARSGGAPDGPGEERSTVTLLAELPRPERPSAGDGLAVHAIDSVDPAVGTGRPGLLAVVPPRTSWALVNRVEELAATTGWPVVGVVGVPTPSRRHRGTADTEGSDPS